MGVPVVAVVGPTASGKSDLAVALATALRGEVVNADAMQLYRGMDVGTAKLTVPERQGIPHHLLDVLDVTEEASVAAYQRQVRDTIARIAAAGRLPVVVGGSGLYLRAALDQLEIPPTDPVVRSRWEAELATVGVAALHRRLATVDPVAAERILPSNGRRIVRALEVVELTGRPFTASLPDPRYLVPTVQLGIRVPRPVLDRRIAERVDRMWQQGLVAETRELQQQGLRSGRTASRALGYAQVLRMLAGEWTDDETRAEVVRATRRYARRQESWFGRDRRIVWLSGTDPDLFGRALAALATADPAARGTGLSEAADPGDPADPDGVDGEPGIREVHGAS